jgi:hypothetical protein
MILVVITEKPPKEGWRNWLLEVEAGSGRRRYHLGHNGDRFSRSGDLVRLQCHSNEAYLAVERAVHHTSYSSSSPVSPVSGAGTRYGDGDGVSPVPSPLVPGATGGAKIALRFTRPTNPTSQVVESITGRWGIQK